MPCVFCQIIDRKIATEPVYENEHAFAFFDHDPVAPGHCLVVPKKHCTNVIDADDEVLAEVVKAAKTVGKLLMERFGSSGFNILCASGKSAQQTVFHLHFHVIPRREDDGLNMWFGRAHGGRKAAE